MAGSVNKVILVGNLGADPEVRRTQDGRPIVNLRVATSESWRDKNTGERREKTEWHRVVIFSEGLAKIAEQYLKKGSKVYLEGALQTRKWQDKEGQDRYSTEVVLQGFNSALTMLDRAGGSGGAEGGEQRFWLSRADRIARAQACHGSCRRWQARRHGRRNSVLSGIPDVMPGLVPGIHVFSLTMQGVDGREEPGHDGRYHLSFARTRISSAESSARAVQALMSIVLSEPGETVI